MTLRGTEGGKAILVGLGKKDEASTEKMRNAGASVISMRKHLMELNFLSDLMI